MFTVVYRTERMERHELAIGDPRALVDLLTILQESKKVVEYKVINSDAGVVKDFKVDFGWGNEYFTKNAPNGFTWVNPNETH